MKNKKIRKRSIVVHIILLLTLVILLQVTFTLNTIILTDITTRIESFSFNNFTKTVSNSKGNLENFMNASWSNVSNTSEEISKSYIEMLGEKDTLDEDEKIEFFSNNVDLIMDLISKTGTTGGFIILDDGENMKYSYSTLYLKSDNYLIQSVNTDNLMLARGSTEISKKYGFSLVSSWSYALDLTEDNIDILEKPMNAVNTTKNLDYLGYWDIIEDVTNDQLKILTYTIPILDENKEPIGIVGVEISQDYLYKFLQADEFGEDGSYGYVLANVEDKESFTPIISSGSVQNKLFNLNKPIELQNLDLERHNLDFIPKVFTVDEFDIDVCIFYQPLNVYANNTPFEGDEIWIAGMVDLENMTSFTSEFWRSMIVMLSISLFGGVWISYFAGKKFAKPIITLSKEVSSNDIRNEMDFKETNIKELDELANVIKRLQAENILRTASKTDKILELLNMGVGSFEYIKGSSKVTISQGVHKMLDIEDMGLGQIIPKDLFFEKLDLIKSNPVEEVKKTYSVGVGSTIKYYTIEEYDQEDAILGVIEDSTKDIEDLLILNYERNYDVLTGIFNRRAFQQKVQELFKNEEMKVAGFVMFDLDNLKYVNDTFGHDSGDVYIKTAANIISSSLSSYGVVGRMSGDEFYAYLHGFRNKDEVLKCLDDLYKRLEVEPIKLPNSKEFKIRMSGGISWYNDDSTNLEDLIKYADFAMYKGKKSSKGELREFNKNMYLEESFMLSGKEELNRILDGELVNFAFQPIINVQTGKIHAYEALMRPISDTLSAPDKFLQIASLEGKLWKVEKMTFFKTLELYKRYKNLFKNAKMFINSIPSENLSDKEYKELILLYEECLPNLVVEITEQEEQKKDVVDVKLEKLYSLGVEIALDDYGSGYANDVSLLNLNPNIVKIDRSIISNVHIDPSRQTIVNKIIVFCKENNIAILGEGIETEQELEYLIGAGIDLAQGYYISRPLEKPDFDTMFIEEKIKELKYTSKS